MQNKPQVLSPELSVQETHYEPLMKAPYHCDRKSRISIILSGGVREIVGNREEAGTPMSIVIKPADARHRNEFSPQGARIVSVCWDANRTPDILSVAGFTEWRWLHGTSPASAGIRFLMQLKNAENQSQLEESIIELMADFTNAGMANHQTPPLWLERIAERLRDEYNRALRVQDLAAAAAVHPVYLARAFRKYYGCSVKEYLHQIRVRRAVQSIAGTHTELAHVAYDEGFADQSHLNRIFKKMLGISPGKFRKLTEEVSFVQEKPLV